MNLAFVPSPLSDPGAPYFYVNELYGSIKVVTRDGVVHEYANGLLNYNPTGAFPGSGEQGLTGLLVDPTSGDLFVTVLHSSDPAHDFSPHYARVLRLHSNDGGLTMATNTMILDLSPEAQRESHQISNLSFWTDGTILVHNGDGFDFSRGLNLDSAGGKVLRIYPNGLPPTDNPFYNAGDGISIRDFIWAYGLRNPFGGATRQSDGRHFSAENGPSVDRLAMIRRGVSYGYTGTDASMATNASYNWNPSVAPVNIAFIEPTVFGGSGFPASKYGHAFVTESGATYGSGPQTLGKKISEFDLDSTGTLLSGPIPLISYIGTGRATASALAAGPDGLYFSDLYKDEDAVSPIEPGANILRISYVGGVDFQADVLAGPAPLRVQFTDDSTVIGASSWAWTFGDGTTSTQRNPEHQFLMEGIYDVSLQVIGNSGPLSATKAGYIFVGAGGGVLGEYFADKTLTNRVLTRIDRNINFDWSAGSPDPAIPANLFSARWTGAIIPPAAGSYTFKTKTDDGARLYVNGQLLIDAFGDNAVTATSNPVTLVAGRAVPIEMDYRENAGLANAKLSWTPPAAAEAVIPTSVLSLPADGAILIAHAQDVAATAETQALVTIIDGGPGPLLDAMLSITDVEGLEIESITPSQGFASAESLSGEVDLGVLSGGTATVVIRFAVTGAEGTQASYRIALTHGAFDPDANNDAETVIMQIGGFDSQLWMMY
ncbi:hypothetical protein BH09SUM1_BH09SUM1_29350 [soil metagenome]